MYAIVYENRILLTQPRWNPKMFNSVLEDELGIKSTLQLSDEIKIPITIEFEKPAQRLIGTNDVSTEVQREEQQPVIDETTNEQKLDENGNPVFQTVVVTETIITQEPVYEAYMEAKQAKILPCREIFPSHNPKIEWLSGPIFEIDGDLVTATYEVKPLDLDVAKGNLIDKLPAARYAKEIKSISIPLNDLVLTVSTDRETRAIYANKLIGMGETIINWKFSEGWTTLNKADLEYIIQQIDFAVQEAFDWELSKLNEIKVCKTLEEIDKVVI